MIVLPDQTLMRNKLLPSRYCPCLRPRSLLLTMATRFPFGDLNLPSLMQPWWYSKPRCSEVLGERRTRALRHAESLPRNVNLNQGPRENAEVGAGPAPCLPHPAGNVGSFSTLTFMTNVSPLSFEDWLFSVSINCELSPIISIKSPFYLFIFQLPLANFWWLQLKKAYSRVQDRHLLSTFCTVPKDSH